MREFFNGWRRKAGVVTLVMACLLSAGWIRSLRISETLSIVGSRGTVECLWSINGSLFWMTCKPWQHAPQSVPLWHQEEFNPLTHSYYILFSHAGYSLLGFGAGSVPREADPNGMSYSFWLVPYWFLVIPLTLLSAYLILWKPRKRTGPDHA